MKTFAAIFIFSILCTVSRLGDAHEMALENNDCHQDGIYGRFHCHEQTEANQPLTPVDDFSGITDVSPKLTQELPVKLNKSNTCVTPDSVIYARQKKYRLYQSVEQCLRDGGHLDGTVVLRQ